MKNLFLSVVVFISANAFAQRNAQDSLNLLKVQELNAVINQKLSGSVSEQDVLDFVTYMWNSKDTSGLQYISMINPDLTEMNADPNQLVDLNYICQAFTQLKNKNNVRVEYIGKDDYSKSYSKSYEVNSDYMVYYKVYFTNSTSFGPNTPNYFDIRIDCINGKFTLMFGILAKI